MGGFFRSKAEWVRVLTVFWEIWLHCNEVVFKGRAVSADRVEHDMRVLFQVGEEGLVEWKGGQYGQPCNNHININTIRRITNLG